MPFSCYRSSLNRTSVCLWVASYYPVIITDFNKKLALDSYKFSNLMDMLAVGQLEKDERYAPQYQLLMIFLNQRLDTYLDYHAANFT